MGPFVIHPRAFPLHLFLCPLGGRGRGCRSVMEVDCGLRKSCGSPFVAPVTGPRRAVTHCDTNAQRPNTPQVLRYPDCCSPTTTAATLSSSPPFVRNILRTHRPLTLAFFASHAHLETKSGEPSSLHQPAPRTLFRAVHPASPTQSRLLRG